jgi:hypothetical protein
MRALERLQQRGAQVPGEQRERGGRQRRPPSASDLAPARQQRLLQRRARASWQREAHVVAWAAQLVLLGARAKSGAVNLCHDVC